MSRSTSEPSASADVGRRLALVGIGAALLSLLIVPYVMGPAALVAGVLGIRRGARRTGWMAVILGIVLATGSILLALRLRHRI